MNVAALHKYINTATVIALSVALFLLFVAPVHAQTCTLVTDTGKYSCTPVSPPPTGCATAGNLMACDSVPQGYTVENTGYVSSFTAMPDTIDEGESAVLTWQTQYTANCEIIGGLGGAGTNVQPSGSQNVSPNRNATYTLSCQNTDQAGNPVGQKRALASIVIGVVPAKPAPIFERTQPECPPGTPPGQLCYTPLEPLPGVEDAQSGTGNFRDLLQGFFRLLVNVGAFVAVTMLVIGGITYMISEATVTKFVAKEKIKAAFWGLAILAGAWLILNTINPQLLTFNINIVDPSFFEEGVQSTTEQLLTAARETKGLTPDQQKKAAEFLGFQGIGESIHESMVYDSAQLKSAPMQSLVRGFTIFCEQRAAYIDDLYETSNAAFWLGEQGLIYVLNSLIETAGEEGIVKTIPGDSFGSPDMEAKVCVY